MDNEFLFKRSMNLGTGTAESDGAFLSECFIETPELETLLDFTDHKMIVLGRTGAGKTALLKIIEGKVDGYVEIRPDTFALQYISNIPFINNLNHLGINLEIFYKFLWMHEILRKVIKAYFSYNGQFITQFIERLKGNTRVAEMKKYFEEYGDIFFEERSAENITHILGQKIEAKVGYSPCNAIHGELSETEKREVQTVASTFVNSSQIAQLKNVLSLLKEYLQSNKQKKIFVAVDDLDVNWISDDTKYKLIGALLSTIRLFADVPGLKIVLAMRADLLKKTCVETGRQNEKDNAFTLKLDWTKNMLWELLDKRIQYLFSHKYQKSYQVKASDVFVQKVGNIPVEDYLISRTMMRPRDLITFVNFCIARSESKDKINEAAILLAENDFLHDRSEALVSEWTNVVPSVRALIPIVRTIPSIFAIEDLLPLYSQIESILLSEGNMDDPIVRKMLDSNAQVPAQVLLSIREMVRIWFLIGLVGKRSSNGALEYATPSHPELDALDFQDAEWFEVHPLFAKG